MPGAKSCTYPINNRRRNKQNQKRRKHPILQIPNRVPQLPKRKPIKYPHDNRNEQLSIQIRGIAPVLDKRPLRQHRGLQPHGRRELGLHLVFRVGCLFAAVGFDAVDFAEHCVVVGGFLPFVVPVDAGAVGALEGLCGGF